MIRLCVLSTQVTIYTYFQLSLPSLSPLSLSLSTLQTSFLRATVSSDDALACLGGCADDSIYTDKKKHFTTNKIYSSATECSKDCLPASKRDATTIACTDKCYKNQAKSVVKTQDKAIKSAADDIM